jgi:hypothetical protein
VLRTQRTLNLILIQKRGSDARFLSSGLTE